MPCKFVIGSLPDMVWIAAAWREAAPGLQVVEVPVEGDAAATVGAALASAEDGDSAFVVVGSARLNMERLELMALVKSQGLAMPPLVCRGAVVAASASVSENCCVGAGAVIGSACSIGYNTVIGAGAIIGNGASVGSSVFIDDGVQVGRGAVIAAHATIGLRVTIGHGVKVGKFSIVDKPGCYTADVAAKTFIHASHDRPIVVVGQ